MLPVDTLFCFSHTVSKIVFTHIVPVFVSRFWRAASLLLASNFFWFPNVCVCRICSMEKGLGNTGLTFHSLQQNLSFRVCASYIISHGACK